MSMGVILGVVVLVMCLGLVALMMWSEWSQAPRLSLWPKAAAPQAKKSARKSCPSCQEEGGQEKEEVGADSAALAFFCPGRSLRLRLARFGAWNDL